MAAEPGMILSYWRLAGAALGVDPQPKGLLGVLLGSEEISEPPLSEEDGGGFVQMACSAPGALSKNQRYLLKHALALPEGQVQAVETPLHTSKERLVADGVACLRAQAALAGATQAPVIVLTTRKPAYWRAVLRGMHSAPRHKATLKDMSVYQAQLQEGYTRLAAIKAIHAETHAIYAKNGGIEPFLALLQEKDGLLERQLGGLTELLQEYQALRAETAHSKWRQFRERFQHQGRKALDVLKMTWHMKGDWASHCFSIDDFSVEQLGPALLGKIEKLRATRTKLHRILSELCGVLAKRSAADLAWFQFQERVLGTKPQVFILPEQAESFFDHTLRQSLFECSEHHWAARGASEILVLEWQDRPPECIDYWISDSAEGHSPLEALPWLQKAKRALVLGDSKVPPRPYALSSEEEMLYLEQARLLSGSETEDSVEEIIDDLGFRGLLLSTATWWQWACMRSYYQSQDFSRVAGSPILQLLDNQGVAPQIIAAAQALGYTALIGDPGCLPVGQVQYWHCKVDLAIPQIALWIRANHQETAHIAVLTPFEPHKEQLQTLFRAQGIQAVVLLLSELEGQSYETVIFSPGVGVASERPFLFDQGTGWLSLALLTARQRFILIGDMEAWDPNTHSASGKLAKFLFAKPEHALSYHQMMIRPGLLAQAQIGPLSMLHAVLADSLHQAQRQWFLVTPRIQATFLQALLPALEAACLRGLEVVLYLGDERQGGALDPVIQTLLQRVLGWGMMVRVVHNLHSSYCWHDEHTFYETPHQWLWLLPEHYPHDSFCLNRYREGHAVSMINTVSGDLNACTTRRFKARKGADVFV